MQKDEVTTSSQHDAKLPVSRRWSDDEKQELKRWLDSGWDWQFPGYSQAALHINSLFGNNRSASACRAMDYRLCNGG